MFNIKKSVAMIMALIFVFSLLTSCGKTVDKTDVSEQSQTSRVPREVVDMFFIGNSLTYTGDIPTKVQAFANAKGMDVRINKKLDGGYTLNHHVQDLKDEKYKDIIEQTDVLILQEIGGLQCGTAEAINNILKLFKDDVKVFMMITDIDIQNNKLDEVEDNKRLNFIYTGEIHDRLIKNGFTYKQLHLPNDFHPNHFYGYVAACAVFSTIFDKTCLGLKYDCVPYDNLAEIPGGDDTEKRKTIQKCQQIVMKVINEHKNPTNQDNSANSNDEIPETSQSPIANEIAQGQSKRHSLDYDNSKGTNILFVGNSLTYIGDIPAKMEGLVKSNGINACIRQKTNGGYYLRQHAEDFSDNQYKNLREKTDILVLQEFGGKDGSTEKAINDIAKLFKKDVKVYILLTEADEIVKRREELKNMSNIKYIYTGLVHDKLTDKDFEYRQLHLVADFHPNNFFGYISACTVFSTLFNKTCIGLKYDFLLSSEVAEIPGKTIEEKDKNILKVQETIMKVIGEQK